ncbi:MAG: MinD/ParA family protein [Candidatus Eisenbacteria bacterium]|uniref:MinD/ParA family protein n=1 Tax=Eiseniibacteriota bacterium TaxID=2212470 RepID=A0A948RX85_UNCEI|nr:MinD/ParA family protein [Candidatus Eisenbacteria bacterium]MBU1950961.1 MinD/ParA family protein [Candidatus Eisenbacteria bacterium]MBU2692166.1 MinD/ParA family protein [Candidatus Eisenbacteria bacterium]
MTRQSPDRRRTPAHLSLIHGTSTYRRPGEPIGSFREPISLSVISGKGGVGKSTLVANLAVLFARRGLKVLVLDGDLSLANVDLLLGLVPQYNLWDVVSGKMTLDDIILEGPHGIKLLPAASGVEDMANLDDYRREVLIRSLDDLKSRHDVFLVDTGSGIHRQNIRLAQATREILILTTPEPTAFSDAYATLKVLLSRPIWNAPRLVLNRVRNGAEARRAARRIRSVAQHFLQMKPEVLGMIPEDDLVLRSIHAQEPFVDMFPKSQAAMALESLADQLLHVEEPPRTRLPGHVGVA